MRAQPLISVIVPIRNEAGTLQELADRIPGLGTRAEAIFVEGGSRDDSWDAAHRVSERAAPGSIRLFKQPNTGKADAVRHGMSHAKGKYAIILDADLGVDPETIPRFIAPLISGRFGLVNGVRSAAHRETGSMRFANSIGNAFFACAMSVATQRRLGDSLCGTKAFACADWRRWSVYTKRWQHKDPFGDFEILAGASGLGLRFMDLPVTYRARRYGETNIRRWRDGARLLGLVSTVIRERGLIKRER